MLRKAKVLTKSNDECEMTYRANMVELPSGSLNQNNVCAVKWTGSACTGDSGGPLSYNINYDYQLRVVQHAIISAGIEHCDEESRDIFPAIYVKVAPYLDWIIDNIKSGESMKP